ncbi:DNA-processing protein DprA [Marinobacter sp. F4216]|uniref:DNA-processing protein DprA n=1 Tax=Marinobacter sp. F4216 TaxID=2874281 RepID=UPI001CBBBFD5|nr:DNA-processing protein DprA [Marinobacter sp. F4216]
MSPELDFSERDFTIPAISPYQEMCAYEALWVRKGSTFKRVADLFRDVPSCLPSELVSESEILEASTRLNQLFTKYQLEDLGVRVEGSIEYPSKLKDARNPLRVFYYQGWWDLISTPSVAVVGARKVSENGIRRTRKLVNHLVNDGFTIASGLAEGVDTTAHETALAAGGKTFAVIGTPLTHIYPKKNQALQERLRKEFLIISQVPFLRYETQDYRSNRAFFPERNITMSALTDATIIVEASDTSGTLYQARAAIDQGRKLFILDSCFRNTSITWPEKYLKKGAIRVRDYEDIRKNLLK